MKQDPAMLKRAGTLGATANAMDCAVYTSSDIFVICDGCCCESLQVTRKSQIILYNMTDFMDSMNNLFSPFAFDIHLCARKFVLLGSDFKISCSASCSEKMTRCENFALLDRLPFLQVISKFFAIFKASLTRVPHATKFVCPFEFQNHT